MFNRKINITTIAALAVVMSLGVTSAQAHRVEITRKGEIKVSNTDVTTKVVATKSGGYRRVVVTSLVERLRSDGSTGVYEVTTSAKVRIEKCPKRAKRCVQQQLKHGPDRLIKIIPASPKPAPVVQSTPSMDCNVAVSAADGCPPAVDSGPSMIAPTRPVLRCTFPPSFIVHPIPGYDFISNGTIWCEVKHDENDPVRVHAVSSDTEPSRFVAVEYAESYTKPCPSDSSCFKAAYPLTRTGAYAFTVSATTDSGQQDVIQGSAEIGDSYPNYPGGNK